MCSDVYLALLPWVSHVKVYLELAASCLKSEKEIYLWVKVTNHHFFSSLECQCFFPDDHSPVPQVDLGHARVFIASRPFLLFKKL